MSEGGCARGDFYKIQEGEAFSSIAKAFGITLEELLAANPYAQPGSYAVGQIIIIPREGAEASPCEYVLNERENLADVLRRLDMSVVELKRLNPDVDLFNLERGDRLRVPAKRAKESGYVIGQGENLASIAKKFGMEQAVLLRLNPNLRPVEFYEGQRIILE